MIYLDGSALCRFLPGVRHSEAWHEWVAANKDVIVTSQLGLTELRQAAALYPRSAAAQVAEIVDRVRESVPVIMFSDSIVEISSHATSVLKPFAALHMGAAVGDERVDGIATYDPALAHVAEIYQLTVFTPGLGARWYVGFEGPTEGWEPIALDAPYDPGAEFNQPPMSARIDAYEQALHDAELAAAAEAEATAIGEAEALAELEAASTANEANDEDAHEADDDEADDDVDHDATPGRASASKAADPIGLTKPAEQASGPLPRPTEPVARPGAYQPTVRAWAEHEPEAPVSSRADEDDEDALGEDVEAPSDVVDGRSLLDIDPDESEPVSDEPAEAIVVPAVTVPEALVLLPPEMPVPQPTALGRELHPDDAAQLASTRRARILAGAAAEAADEVDVAIEAETLADTEQEEGGPGTESGAILDDDGGAGFEVSTEASVADSAEDVAAAVRDNIFAPPPSRPTGSPVRRPAMEQSPEPRRTPPAVIIDPPLTIPLPVEVEFDQHISYAPQRIEASGARPLPGSHPFARSGETEVGSAAPVPPKDIPGLEPVPDPVPDAVPTPVAQRTAPIVEAGKSAPAQPQDSRGRGRRGKEKAEKKRGRGKNDEPQPTPAAAPADSDGRPGWTIDDILNLGGGKSQ